MEQFVLDVAGISDRGIKRDHNEDAWSGPLPGLTSKELARKGRLYVVADGVGGHLAGDVASKMATEIIQQRYYADPSPDVAASLQAAIQAASEQIDRESAARLEQRGMSTTVTAVVLREDVLTVANVGDSRTYLIREGQARQLTADHTWVEEQVKIGLITREEAARHPQRNIITRSLGGNQQLDVDIFEEEVGPGDRVLLCSDGLSNMVSKEEIGAIASNSSKAEAVVKELVELAKERGAPDNVTAVVLYLVRRARRGWLRFLLIAGLLGGFALFAGWLAFGGLAGRDGPRPTPEPSATALATPTDTPSPTLTPMADIPPPELVWPAEDTTLVSGDPITFTWEWPSGPPPVRFTFSLQASADSQFLVREELSSTQSRFVLPQSLSPGRYLWTLSGGGTDQASVGRLFSVIEPTPTSGAGGS